MSALAEPTWLSHGGAHAGQLRSNRTASMATNCAVDVVIIGGGPAGSATAIALAKLGWSATILERSALRIDPNRRDISARNQTVADRTRCLEAVPG